MVVMEQFLGRDLAGIVQEQDRAKVSGGRERTLRIFDGKYEKHLEVLIRHGID